MKNSEINFVYFAGEPLGVPALEELFTAELVPRLVVCSPDKPVGRKQTLTPPPVKTWAEKNHIPTWQPTSYKSDIAQERATCTLGPILGAHSDTVFVVVAYNYILPQWLLDLSPRGVVNMHPSMLPKLRGASPIRTAIRDDLRDHIGVSIMLIDNQMDHGPILKQLHMPIADEKWPVPGPELDIALAKMGGAMLAETLPKFLSGEILPVEQNHAEATYCSRLTKADSELNIDPHNLPSGKLASEFLNKINAFAGIGDTFFVHKGCRVKIKEAQISFGNLCLLTIVPEGKQAVSFDQWLENQG